MYHDITDIKIMGTVDSFPDITRSIYWANSHYLVYIEDGITSIRKIRDREMERIDAPSKKEIIY